MRWDYSSLSTRQHDPLPHAHEMGENLLARVTACTGCATGIQIVMAKSQEWSSAWECVTCCRQKALLPARPTNSSISSIWTTSECSTEIICLRNECAYATTTPQLDGPYIFTLTAVCTRSLPGWWVHIKPFARVPMFASWLLRVRVLFASGSGDLDLNELKLALKALKQQAAIAEQTRRRVQHTAEQLRAKAARYEEASNLTIEYERAAAMLSTMRAELPLEAQLGSILRGPKGSRVNDMIHQRGDESGEISRSAFRAEVTALGVVVSNEELDHLFNRIDQDSDGYLDAAELRIAFKQLGERSDATHAQMCQMREALREKESAAREAQAMWALEMKAEHDVLQQEGAPTVAQTHTIAHAEAKAMHRPSIDAKAAAGRAKKTGFDARAASYHSSVAAPASSACSAVTRGVDVAQSGADVRNRITESPSLQPSPAIDLPVSPSPALSPRWLRSESSPRTGQRGPSSSPRTATSSRPTRSQSPSQLEKVSASPPVETSLSKQRVHSQSTSQSDTQPAALQPLRSTAPSPAVANQVGRKQRRAQLGAAPRISTYQEPSLTDRIGGPVPKGATRAPRQSNGIVGAGAVEAAAAVPTNRNITWHFSGDGMERATCREEATFQIAASDESGASVGLCNEPIKVAVRGVQAVRSRLTPNPDGSITVGWQPRQSGKYEIVITHASKAIPGSPWIVQTSRPEPHASQCIIRGDGLLHAVARTPTTFEVSFRDALGAIASAVDLEVFVERALTAEGVTAAGTPAVEPAPHEVEKDATESVNGICRRLFGDMRGKLIKSLVVSAEQDPASRELGQVAKGAIVLVTAVSRPREADEVQQAVRGRIVTVSPSAAIATGVAMDGITPILEGWVTLKQGGKAMIDTKQRLDPAAREAHTKHWSRQQRTDRLQPTKKAEGSAPALPAGALESTAATHAEPQLAGAASAFVDELKMATDSCGFAYGGAFPGALHAKGVLHEFHKISYSVSLAGVYLLHVRLRQQAMPLTGSPFLLKVEPDEPYGPSTVLDGSGFGEAGEWNVFMIQAKDRVGNSVTKGGCQILCSISGGEEVQTNVVDKLDGRYELHVMSRKPGSFQLHASIDGLPLKGSPATFTFRSTIPDMASTELTGAGLQVFKQNEPAIVDLTLFDQHGNRCSPPSSFCEACKVSMSITSAVVPGTKPKPLSEQTAFDDVVGEWLTHSDGGRFYRLTYTRREGGTNLELQLWYTIEGSGSDSPERISLHEKAFPISEGVTKRVEKTMQVMPGDYCISKRVFGEAQERWGTCEIDAFASEATAMTLKFFIPGNHDDSEADIGTAMGADATHMNWMLDERVWAHPPIALLPKLVDVLEAPNCTAEVLVCTPDEHEVSPYMQYERGTLMADRRSTPEWYTRLLALSTDRVRYPPGELHGVAPDAPSDVKSWPICVFRVPPKRRIMQRRNAIIKIFTEGPPQRLAGLPRQHIETLDVVPSTAPSTHRRTSPKRSPRVRSAKSHPRSPPSAGRERIISLEAGDPRTRQMIAAMDWTGLRARREKDDSRRPKAHLHTQDFSSRALSPLAVTE